MAYFDSINKKYEGRGVEWFVRENHYWLEIRINKEKAEVFRRSNNYDPFRMDTNEDRHYITTGGNANL